MYSKNFSNPSKLIIFRCYQVYPDGVRLDQIFASIDGNLAHATFMKVKYPDSHGGFSSSAWILVSSGQSRILRAAPLFQCITNHLPDDLRLSVGQGFINTHNVWIFELIQQSF